MAAVMSVITLSLEISQINAIFPFDEFMTSDTNDSVYQSPEDPFASDLPGEHGESPDEDLDSYFESKS